MVGGALSQVFGHFRILSLVQGQNPGFLLNRNAVFRMKVGVLVGTVWKHFECQVLLSAHLVNRGHNQKSHEAGLTNPEKKKKKKPKKSAKSGTAQNNKPGQRAQGVSSGPMG